MFLVATVTIFSCTKEGTSKPSYNFKKAPKEGLAAKIGDIEITHKELTQGIENEIYEEEKKIFDIKMSRMKALVLEKLMKNDPNKKGLTNDQYMEKYIAKNVKVSKSEIDNFVKEKQIPKERLNPQIMERIKEFLLTDKKRVAVDDWIAKKTKKSGIDVFIDKPRRPSYDVEVGSAPQTNKDAKVTIVEFSDFQCPYCSKASETVNELKKKYGKKINVVFKQYPLPFHNQAKIAANAALCAHEQKAELFWKMHDAMFGDQSKLSESDLVATAKKIGVKEGDFKKCMESKKYFAQIEKDIEQGKKLNVKSTPTFFVNGKLVTGAQPVEVFSELIDEDL
tara:strand:+ start:88006 stop:89016 length:1011 start_codon:yes stop_codon:yes gene_type:complete